MRESSVHATRSLHRTIAPVSVIENNLFARGEMEIDRSGRILERFNDNDLFILRQSKIAVSSEWQGPVPRTNGRR